MDITPLDTDERMEKSLNPSVEKDIAFMGFEDGKVLSMGVMGFPPKHHLIAELLEYYNQPFSKLHTPIVKLNFFGI